MEKPKILLFGAGGHAKVVVDIIEKENIFQIYGLIDEKNFESNTFLGYPLYQYIDSIVSLNIHRGIVTIGNNDIRAMMIERITRVSPNFEFLSTIHPDASIARNVFIGNGTVVMAGVRLGTETKIGKHCIINSNASVDHECQVGSLVNISPCAAIGGKVTIGNGAFVGIGTSVKERVSIGRNTFVGAGSVVVNDLSDDMLAYGSPCRPIRKITVGDKFI